jgi:hypothetical protein
MTTVAQLVKVGFPRPAAERVVKQDKIAARLYAKDPSLGITAHIMAGDQLSAQERLRQFRAGEMTAEQAVFLTGSYARVKLAHDLWREGALSDEWIVRNLCHLWRGADPDDTDPRFLSMWKRARTLKGRYLRDGKGLPRSKVLTVYRGQDAGTKPGIAWSLDKGIAEKFANGAALRQRGRDGEILVARINRDAVLGYNTGRGESEVVWDPFDDKALAE